jgi:hypothetical protein
MPAFDDKSPKVEFPGTDFLKDTSSIRNLTRVSHPVTMMQEYMHWDIINFLVVWMFSRYLNSGGI